MLQMVKVAIGYTIINSDLSLKRVLSAWNRKFVVMKDQEGAKNVSKFYLDPKAANVAGGRLIADVTFDPNVTDVPRIVAHFDKFLEHMKPKVKGHPKRHKYDVAKNFEVYERAQDVPTPGLDPAHAGT